MHALLAHIALCCGKETQADLNFTGPAEKR